MIIDLVTREDLDAFGKALLLEIKALMPAAKPEIKQWLKHKEVIELLGISTNTLQRLRIANKLPSTKVGGVHYYRYEDVEKLFEGPKKK